MTLLSDRGQISIELRLKFDRIMATNNRCASNHNATEFWSKSNPIQSRLPTLDLVEHYVCSDKLLCLFEQVQWYSRHAPLGTIDGSQISTAI